MRIYSIEFHILALKEWNKLDPSVQHQFKKQLEKRASHPRVPSAELHGDLKNFYKIKLKSVGYRLVYEVIDHRLVIMIIAVGKINRSEVYEDAYRRK